MEVNLHFNYQPKFTTLSVSLKTILPILKALIVLVYVVLLRFGYTSNEVEISISI